MSSNKFVPSSHLLGTNWEHYWEQLFINKTDSYNECSQFPSVPTIYRVGLVFLIKSLAFLPL
jgi:hypothetical protein